MIWTDEMAKAVKVVEKELKEVGGWILNKTAKVMLACNIVEALAKKNLIKEEN